jgi:signal transduction histidine kinase
MGIRTRSRSLRARVASMVGLLAALLALCVAVAAGFASWQRERSSAPDRAESLAFDVADLGNNIFDEVEGMYIPKGQLAFVLNPNGNATIADADVNNRVVNRALRSSVLDAARGEFVSFSAEQVDGISWSFASLLCADQDLCRTIVTGASTPTLRAYFIARWPFGLLAAVVGGLCSFLAAFWLVGRSLRPIELMRKELASITSSNLDQRITLTRSGDEVERVGITLNETLDRLDHAVKANERFVADAAHELRSPLTGIRLALEIESVNKPVSLLNDAIVEVERATRLVDDLLLLANRASSQTKQTDVDFDDVVREELARFSIRHPKVRIDCQSAPVWVSIDREAMRRVVGNLLDNAAFYGRGHVALTLEATPLSTDGPQLRSASRPISGFYSNRQAGLGTPSSTQLHIDDDGPGIKPADRTRVFERFTRLDSSRARSTGGSGLGLAIAKEIADDHHATITISDSSLGGARFTVTLPH